MPAPLRLLLIDDNPDDRALVIRELHREFTHLEVTQITDANAFAQALAVGNFELLITDYELGWSDGVAVLHAVRARWPDCPAIMFTGSGSEAVAVEAMKAGLDDYLIKSPQHFARLPAMVRAVLADCWQRRADREAENRYLLRTLIDNLPDYIYLKDTASRFIVGNLALAHIVGLTAPDQMVGKTDFDFYPPGLAAKYRANDEAVIQTGQPLINEEEPVIDATGNWRWVMTTKVPLRDASGSIIGLVGIGRDNTEHREIEAALVHERDLLHLLMDNSLDAIYFKDTASRFTRINKAQARDLGLDDPAEAIGKTDFDFFTEELAQKAYTDEQRIMATGEPLVGGEEKITWPNGREKWVSVTKLPLYDTDGQLLGTFGISRDITASKQAEAALRQTQADLEKRVQERTAELTLANAALQAENFERRRAEARQQAMTDGLRNIVSLADELIATPNVAMLLRRAVELAQAKLGLERCAIFLEKDGQLYGTYGVNRQGKIMDEHAQHIDTPPAWQPYFETSAAQATQWIIVEEPLREWDGEKAVPFDTGWIAITSIHSALKRIGVMVNDTALSHDPLDPIKQEIVAVYCSLLGNILERKQTEEALAHERDLLHALMDNIPDTIYFKDIAGRFTRINRAQAQLLGIASPEDAIGKTDFDYFTGEHSQVAYADEQRIFQSGQPMLDKVEEPRLSTGQGRWVSATKVPIRDQAGNIVGLVGISRDITERKHHELELEVIVTISAALRKAHTRAEMLPIVLEQAQTLMEADGAALVTRDQAKGAMILELATGKWASLSGQTLPPGSHVSQGVISTNQPYLNNQAAPDGNILHPEIDGNIRSFACVPLIAQEQTLGALWVGRQTYIQTDELNLLTAMANIAANAIHRATLHEQTEQQVQRLAALRAIDAAISSSIDLRLTLSILLDQLTSQLRVHAADILLMDQHSQTLYYAAGRGFRVQHRTTARLLLGRGHAGRAALERRIVSIPNLTEAADDLVRAHLADEKFVGYYAVPLVAKGQVKGVLEIFHRTPLAPSLEWLDFLETLAGQAAIAIDNATLFEQLQHSNVDLTLAYDATIEGWSRALDLRDQETEGHTQRVTEVTMRLGRAMGFSEAELVQIRRGALLHDIGKMGIPDNILLKPEPLTPAEWDIMRRHPVYAYDLLTPITFLRPALDIPYCHHERWNGTGYPRQLKGELIPFAARIFAVADVWDALSSDRPYRPQWPKVTVMEYIHEQAGQQFDPRVVEVFLREISQL